jgi:hypothetical protein
MRALAVVVLAASFQGLPTAVPVVLAALQESDQPITMVTTLRSMFRLDAAENYSARKAAVSQTKRSKPLVSTPIR